MKKLAFLSKATLLVFFALLSQLAFAQKVIVSGVIKNQEGAPLHRALVKEIGGDKAKTDSVGIFKLTVKTPAKLNISCVGYHDTTVNVTEAIELTITLRGRVNIAGTRDGRVPIDPSNSINMAPLKTAMAPGGSSVNPVDNRPVLTSMAGGIVVYSQRYTDFDAVPGTIFPEFNPKEETKGSRFFYKTWVHGMVVNNKGEVNSGEKYMFNYDKIGGALLATKDRNSAIEVDRDKVSSFTMIGTNGDTVTFANVPQIDPAHYLQLLASGNKYKIYKAIKTNFTKANYSTDGVMTIGNNYDEYIDESIYYVLNVQTNQIQKIIPKKKALREVFANEGNKSNKFISDHSSDDIDDTYLTRLGNVLNE